MQLNAPPNLAAHPVARPSSGHSLHGWHARATGEVPMSSKIRPNCSSGAGANVRYMGKEPRAGVARGLSAVVKPARSCSGAGRSVGKGVANDVEPDHQVGGGRSAGG